MAKFDQIKMQELVKVEETDELILIFQENKKVRIKVVDGKLVSEFV